MRGLPIALLGALAVVAISGERARAEGVPPYVILHDRSLREIARRRPGDLAALRTCYGVGPAKAERWGEAVLAVVREH